MNKTKIDWPGLTHTWNPVVGCRKGCSYCYAKKMNNRFKWIKKWDEPEFFIDRLIKPALVKKPSKAFVGSICDLFGEWVDKTWIWQILDVVRQNEHHEFMFLTKNPKRYREFNFPKNSWLGATIESETYYKRYFEIVKYSNTHVKKFISIEPILSDFYDGRFQGLDLVIVGAMTGAGAVKPEKGWIDSITHPNTFYKNNIKKYL